MEVQTSPGIAPDATAEQPLTVIIWLQIRLGLPVYFWTFMGLNEVLAGGARGRSIKIDDWGDEGNGALTSCRNDQSREGLCGGRQEFRVVWTPSLKHQCRWCRGAIPKKDFELITFLLTS